MRMSPVTVDTLERVSIFSKPYRRSWEGAMCGGTHLKRLRQEAGELEGSTGYSVCLSPARGEGDPVSNKHTHSD